MPIQAPQWTEFLSCPVCYNVFNEKQHRPISLACGHTVCKACLLKLQQRKCPFDQSLISRDIGELPVNFALLQLVCATAVPDNTEDGIPKECRQHYEAAKSFIEELALLLKPVSSASTGSIITPSSSSSATNCTAANCVLSRPMQRKLITLVNCQLVEEEGRSRAVRAARSLGERTVTELILQHQNPQQLSSNLWAAVRGRGCQFLGPAMQEEVLHLILLALEDGSALSRKVLVLFVVQRLECQYPQASKTAIGHVVQLLYRASCFKVTKRDQESSLMQLKEEYRSYETLRREHDTQIVQIAMEAGLRIAPDQWSSLLYGDSTHKSHMQSIIDKLQTPQTFSQSVSELLIALQRTGDPHSLQRLRPQLEFLSSIDPSPDVPCPSWENLEGVLKAARTVVEGLVTFLQNSGHKKHDFLTPFNNVRYKTSMCRDFGENGSCPRGSSCTFAHSEEELERYRQKNKKAAKGGSGVAAVPPVGKALSVPGGNQERDSHSHVSSDSEEGSHTLVQHFHSLNMDEDSPQGATQGHQGATGYGPMVAAVLPNAHHSHHMPPSQQPQQLAQPMNMSPAYQGHHQGFQGQGHPSNQGYLPQVPPQGYQGQTPPYQGHAPYQGHSPYPGYMGQTPGQDMQGQGTPQGIQGQSPHQPGKFPPPPMIPPPHYDLMGFPGAGMGRGKYTMPPPMNPMMYMYPGMPPYMPYYHPGFMPQGGMRYHCEGYRPQLNPYAEPWSPHSQQQFSHDFMAMTGPPPVETFPQAECSVCSHKKPQTTMVTVPQSSQGDLHLANTVTISTAAQVKPATETSQADVTQNRIQELRPTATTVDAVISRQSLSNLQERRNSLLAIMKHRQKNPKSSEQEGASKDSCGMKSYKDLIERMKGQSSFSRDTDQREQTLEHPLPRDAGPPGLRATDPSQANLFKRLGALTGFPSGSVNDSIMASWMTSALSASSTKNNNSATTKHSSALDLPHPGEESSYLDTISSTSDPAWGISTSLEEYIATSSMEKQSSTFENNWSVADDEFPYWKDVSRTVDSPSPTPQAVPSSQNHSESAFSSYSQIDQNPIVTSLGLGIFSSQASLASVFASFSQMEFEQEDVIPFDPPIISKFGPISRNRLTKNNNTIPLKVTADEMMKTVPVTVVTPLSRPPLPNAATVPSRFTPSSLPTALDTVASPLPSSSEPEPYSLWKKEVIQLEQKAQEASTEDERLSVELQAVEMQISMKKQELQVAQDVQRAQRQASEYMKQQKQHQDDNIQFPVDRVHPERYNQQH